MVDAKVCAHITAVTSDQLPADDPKPLGEGGDVERDTEPDLERPEVPLGAPANPTTPGANPDGSERQHAPEGLNDAQRLTWANQIVNEALTRPIPQPPRLPQPRPAPPEDELEGRNAGEPEPSRFTGMLERLLALEASHDDWERARRDAGNQ